MNKNSLNLFKRRILDILFCRRCRYCGEVIDLREECCSFCSENLEKIEGKICSKCGCEVEGCVCKGGILFYKKICAPFYYRGAVKKAIWQLKFKNKEEAAEILAEDMADCFNKRFKGYDFDLCTFVPATKKAVKERGYNQSELIATALSKLTDIQCKELLVKSFETEPQHTLPEMRRTGNIVGCFDLKENVVIENMRILLCDDVKTTGSTLNECAKTLLLGGAAEVFCITAAISSKTSEEINT